ncbi:UNKNOWN [Stylonychia lemnae]|uniref:Bromo domain-containing protein n=1 Tax=Stylonychia lemnae TaxID=5949 RepID=A0A078A382_STYLE|nr:UNKNOWN [Stylonychia lemnae]|eukprot:CDW76627.1 UNKNOWN [Stylonychia lemnae]
MVKSSQKPRVIIEIQKKRLIPQKKNLSELEEEKEEKEIIQKPQIRQKGVSYSNLGNYCIFDDLVQYLEHETKLNLHDQEILTKDQTRIRNEILFPFLKDNAVMEDKNDTLLLEKERVQEFLNILASMFSEIKVIAFNYPAITFKKWVNYKPQMHLNENIKPILLIRRHDLNLHKYDTRNKNLLKILEQSGDYIDEIDLDMLRKKQKLDMQNYKQPQPKWMNFAWDAFRIVDNHSKSMIFMMPDEPKNEEYLDYIKCVDKPISLETIRNKLNMRHYTVFEEFIDDMNTLFDNWIKFRGVGNELFNFQPNLEHKMFKYCDAVQKRFDKFVEKAKQKSKQDS